ncbi:hypothetical protein C1H46_031574 [Malus baccata]|uniref:Ribulose bisphosphate carboxylase/oxygenase activase AAA helical domain-containing protein n=1 Tax=Malus baccata TaxID=106549 RepID=A0A540L9D4_MALBA|nr:hypothetical protein C1H46_031574 [Malus baccata]
MILCSCYPFLSKSPIFSLPFPPPTKTPFPISSLCCSTTPSSVPDPQTDTNDTISDSGGGPNKKRLSDQSSWEAKDSEGNDYLYRLGKEADNMNIAVGARAGLVDDLFVGKFLGRDSDIVFDYRQKVTRSFQYLQGDYYVAPLFMDKVVCHIAKNYLAPLLNTKVPLILGIWGGKGQGKSFQTELIFQAMGVEPVIMSAGELESERAGEPGKLIRERYRTASQVVQNQVRSSTTFTVNISLDFYGALRSRTYDRSISKWVDDIGGVESLGNKLIKGRKNDSLPVFTPPEQTMEALLESGYSLIKEQQLIMETKLSKVYMKNMDD